MFGMRLVIHPTGGLTFRQMPGSMLRIGTYPFLPPTTMSGFLRRLAALTTSRSYLDAVDSPETRAKNPRFYVLPRRLCALGAYPERWCVHATKRQGAQYLKHDAFSRIHRRNDSGSGRRQFQLHDWEYLFVESLVGYVLSEDRELLLRLRCLANYGCKLGKEGYAFVDAVSGVSEWVLQRVTVRPSTVVPASLLSGVPCEIFPLYRYAWSDQTKTNDPFGTNASDDVRGFARLVVGVVDQPLEADYYTDGESYIPKALVDELTMVSPT